MGRSERKHGRKKELSNRIELGLGFEELRERMGDGAKTKSGNQKKKLSGSQKLVGFRRQFEKSNGPKVFPKNMKTVSERNGNRRFRTILENMGARSILQNSGWPILTKRC